MKRLSLNNKGFGLTGVLLVILVLAAVGGAGAYVYHKNHKAITTTTSSTKNSNSSSSKTDNNSTSTTKTDPYAGWKTYTSTREGFSIKYPPTWTLDPATGYLSDGSTDFDSPDGLIVR